MTREIKFRAWDKLEYRFVYSNKPSDFGFWKWVAYDDTTPLMQYTGLKDKNGVEIYEGDIVRAELNFKVMDDEVVEPKIFEVIYQFASFSLAADGIVEEFGYVYMSEYPPDKMEVIGNVHENPELLK